MARTFRLTAFVLGSVLVLTLLVSRQVLAQQGSDPQVLQLGAALYSENCAVCHGEQGEGRIGATLSKNWPSVRPDLTVKNVIVDGVPGSPMPAWSQDKGGPLTTDEIDALVAYILTWNTGEPFIYVPDSTPTLRPELAPVAEVDGDPNHGAVLFDENCAMCHGANGEGRIGARLAKDWPSIRPDLNVRNVIVNGVSGSPMPAWSTANGGPLSEQDINDLTAFILALPHSTVQQPAPTAVVEPITPASSAVGVILTIVLFFVIVFGILMVQRKKS